ncbi:MULTISPECIES: Asp-tRNA(Asn)/Glu-tRNA(Gln) amidotransferase subunit GatC [unclassified Parvimonas]|uniref:Asp-tRNA(Asn)/Glu-tRNA(Gln) amidotransferase subunit GatC n=1 Tax=unclassified Parvimonas TaxID=1151464 RepID=UPI002B47A2AC|nr:MULTISPECIES: Asp-tRNA(Asn)/Glu-tRNA(Gln) amidotransferase subunit GatC [unclassified Parvimonas]MEB3024808.1 Asp-tRNA(Asn)/Glu-tRNA(Gln) amidotransferase subunit GatC [Parvimonas sp. M13]MEB3089044.1 Asp-tRNA(Asn)/Glu-tRNA(Gln) amidotransferase subunit GatC [Parvimonas sp. M20]
MVSKEEVKKIYYLANLNVKEEKLDIIAKKFDDVLVFANEIMEVDTSECKALEIVVEHNSPLREDVVEESISREDALLNARDKEYGYFRLQRVVK